MGLIESLLTLIDFLIVFVPVCIGFAILVFAVIGIDAVYRNYKARKWQQQYGHKLDEETIRNRWEQQARLSDRVFLLEEAIRRNGIESSMDPIDKVLAEVDYDARYNAWMKVDGKCTVYTISSMSGGFGSSEEAQADINKDFDSYEEQIKQELREQLNKTFGEDR